MIRNLCNIFGVDVVIRTKNGGNNWKSCTLYMLQFYLRLWRITIHWSEMILTYYLVTELDLLIIYFILCKDFCHMT